MNKIKILFVPSDSAGVGHYRSIWPAQEIQKKYSDEFFVEINLDFVNDINYYKSFDIVHFHRQLGNYDGMQSLISELRKSGVIVIMDIDDYWVPPTTHPMYIAAMKEKLPEKITSSFKMVDYVTTTTNIFGKHIKKYNPNIQIIPNGIDMNHRMWKDEQVKKPDDKLRISWIGGSSHKADLELLRPSMNILHGDDRLRDKYQLVMCGYDVRGYMTELGKNGEHVSTRKIRPEETVWNQFEEIFTSNYDKRLVSEEYKNYLLKYSNEQYKEDLCKESYVRRWTLPLTKYGEHYNYCDVCMAPLEENIFNEVKSELKIIEAGLKKKVLIAQSFSIYKELITNGVNGILIDKKNNTRGWYESIKFLINNPDKVKELSQNLYDFVVSRYTLEVVTKNRVEFYRNIVTQKRAKPVENEFISA